MLHDTTSPKPEDRLLRIRDIIPRKLPIGKSTWWLWVSQGRMPQPIRIGPRCSVWKESEIDAAIEALASARNG